MRKLPTEAVAAALAVTTVFISIYLKLPAWAIFVSWAGTFAAGGPNKAVLSKMWFTMPIGSIFACATVLCTGYLMSILGDDNASVAESVALFVVSGSMMLIARTPPLRFLPGMFFGFASFFAVYLGGFAFSPHELSSALVTAILANALGPIYAWLTMRLSSRANAAS